MFSSESGNRKDTLGYYTPKSKKVAKKSRQPIGTLSECQVLWNPRKKSVTKKFFLAIIYLT